jgi:Mrp family chromosome partitioning ATPase
LTTGVPEPALASLLAKKLVVVTGKGGVGKTVVAAVLGRLAARRGKRALVLEVDPRESLHNLFALPPSGGDIVAVDERLYLQNVKPREVLDRVVTEQVKVGFVVRRVLESPVYHHLATGMPGLKELAVLHHAYDLVRGKVGPRIDLVLLDSPASGHGLTLLAAPRVTHRAAPDGPIGRLADELASFVEDPARCGVVVATRAEEMPVEESLELAAGLERWVGRRPDHLVINGLYPALPAGHGALPPELALWGERRAINERERSRLAERWSGSQTELPLLPFERGPQLVDTLADAWLEG